MRQNTLVILAAVTLPVAALAVLLPKPASIVAAQPAPTGPLLPGLATKLGVTAQMTIAGPDGTLTLHRNKTGAPHDEGWSLLNKDGYPVPPATIKPVLDGLVALRGVEPKTEDPALYSRLDLGAPGKGSEARQITLADSSGMALASVILGRHKYDPTGGGNDRIYARVPGQKRTWLAQPALTLPAETLDWISKSVADLDPDQIREVDLTPASGPVLKLTRAKAGDTLAVQNLPPGSKLKSDNPGADIAAAFQAIELTDVKAATAANGPKLGTAHAVTFDGLTLDLALSKQGDTVWATVNAAGTGAAAKKAADITVRTTGWAYALPDTKATPLETKLADITEPAPKAAEQAAKPAAAGAAPSAKPPGK